MPEGRLPKQRAGRSLCRVEAMVTPDGWRVEQILVQRHLSRPAKPMLRVRKGSYLIADCATIAEVARHVDLAALVPDQRES